MSNKTQKSFSKKLFVVVMIIVTLLTTADSCSVSDPKTWPSIYGSCSQFNSCPSSK